MTLRFFLLSTALCLLSATAGAAGADSPRQREVHLIYMGGNDCPPCVAWRDQELPKLRQTSAFKAAKFSMVTKSIRSTVPASFQLPEEVKPYKDRLDEANGRNIGSPQTAIMVDGKVYDYYWGSRSAQDIESMLAAIREGTPYPFPRCVRRTSHWFCQDGG